MSKRIHLLASLRALGLVGRALIGACVGERMQRRSE